MQPDFSVCMTDENCFIPACDFEIKDSLFWQPFPFFTVGYIGMRVPEHSEKLVKVHTMTVGAIHQR